MIRQKWCIIQPKLELEEQVRQNRLLELDKLITESGKSIEEIKYFLLQN